MVAGLGGRISDPLGFMRILATAVGKVSPASAVWVSTALWPGSAVAWLGLGFTRWLATAVREG